MSRLRVLHVATVPATIRVLLLPIASHQRELGYHVEFATGPGDYLTDIQSLDFPIHVLPLSRHPMRLSHVTAVVGLTNLIRQRQYHVIHTHTPIASFLARIAGHIAKAPIVIYHMRGSFWHSQNTVTRTAFTVAEKIVSRMTTHTFTINCLDANELVKRRITAINDVTCLHCGSGGVNIDKFQADLLTQSQYNQLRAEFNLSPNDTVLGYVGRLVRDKGIFELVAAFHKLVCSYPSAKLLIVGGTLDSERDKTTESELQALIRSHKNLRNSVVFTGFRDDVANLMQIMDVIVLPSRREGFGMVLAEAAACGKPSITTETRGSNDAVQHENTGLVVPIEDVEALYEAMLLLVEDPVLRQKMGINGRHLAETRFDQKVVLARIEQVYENLLLRKNLLNPNLSSTRNG